MNNLESSLKNLDKGQVEIRLENGVIVIDTTTLVEAISYKYSQWKKFILGERSYLNTIERSNLLDSINGCVDINFLTNLLKEQEERIKVAIFYLTIYEILKQSTLLFDHAFESNLSYAVARTVADMTSRFASFPTFLRIVNNVMHNYVLSNVIIFSLKEKILSEAVDNWWESEKIFEKIINSEKETAKSEETPVLTLGGETEEKFDVRVVGSIDITGTISQYNIEDLNLIGEETFLFNLPATPPILMGPVAETTIMFPLKKENVGTQTEAERNGEGRDSSDNGICLIPVKIIGIRRDILELF